MANQFTILIVVLFILFSSPNLKAQSKGVEERLEQAATLIRDKRIVEAEQQLIAVLRVVPNEARALNLLGTIRAQQGRLNEAETLFQRSLRIDRRFVGTHMNLAYLYLLKGAPQKSITELKVALRLDPKNTDALSKLARLLLSQGKTDDCIDLIEKTRQSGPPPTQLLVILGDAYLAKGNPDKAEESYLLALDEQSYDAGAALGLVQVAQVRGDPKTSSVWLSRAKALVVNSPDLLYRYALVALRTGAYEQANAALQQAVILRPDEPAYFLALGTSWLKKPDVFEAENAFRRALLLQPDNAKTQMFLGYSLLQQKKHSEARAWLEKSIQKDTRTPETFYYLGLIAQEQNEDERAIELFARAIALDPSFAYPHIALGSVYLKRKNYPLAQRALETGVKLKPNDSEAHYKLAILYARLKDQKRAQAEIETVERLKSSSQTQEAKSEGVAPPIPQPR